MSFSLPVAYVHNIETFRKGIDQSGPFINVVYRIANYGDVDNFINALMGFGSGSGPGGSGTVTKASPHQYQQSPNLYCQSAVMIEGLGNPILSSAAFPNYDGGALIQAEYRASKFDFGPLNYGEINNQFDPATPLTYCTQELDFTTEIFTVAENAATTVPAKIKVPITIMNLTFHDVPYMPLPGIRALRGRVNSTTFLGSSAGLVHFRGGKTTRKFNTDGTIVQEVYMCFEERDANYPWNSGPSAANPYTWAPVVDSLGNKPFQTGDLNALLIF
jgi:hypothetical protein